MKASKFTEAQLSFCVRQRKGRQSPRFAGRRAVNRGRTLTPHARSQSRAWDADRRPDPTPIHTSSLATALRERAVSSRPE